MGSLQLAIDRVRTGNRPAHSFAPLSIAPLVLLGALACGSGAESPGSPAPRTDEPDHASERSQTAPPAATVTCDERHAAVRAAAERARAMDDACAFDVDCVEARFVTACGSLCGLALHPRGLGAFEAERARIDTELCAPLLAAGCAPVNTECAPVHAGDGSVRCALGHCVFAEGDAPLGQTPIPRENAGERADAAPPRPPIGDADERARRLFDAIVRDDPARAQDFFFPREAFAHVKAMTEADAYWQRLFARYEADIHALHASVPDLANAQYLGLEIVRRGGWVRPGEEGNALPYHAARHNVLHYRAHDEEHTLEVRVLITWGDRWYITHLSEFH